MQQGWLPALRQPPRGRQSQGGAAESAPVGGLVVRAQAVRVFLTPLPKRAVGAGGKCQIASPGKGRGLAACQGGNRGVIWRQRDLS